MKLPGILQEISEAAGEEAALKIARAKGGTEVYLPSREAFGSQKAHWLRETVGNEAALKILDACVSTIGLRLIVPTASNALRAAQIRERLDRGEAISFVALAVGCHARTVYRHRRLLREQRARAARRQCLTKRK